MFKKINQLSIISTFLVSFIHLPTLAETATSQNGTQSATITGTNNQLYQVINQTIINHPGRGLVNRDEKKDKIKKNNNQSSTHRDRNSNSRWERGN